MSSEPRLRLGCLISRDAFGLKEPDIKVLTWDQVHARRLARSQLLDPAPDADAAAVVSRLCGVQAQVITAAELDLSVRTAGRTLRTTRDWILRDRQVVKTYGMRGTLHLLPVDELPLWGAMMMRPQAWGGPPWHHQHGLAGHQAGQLLAAMWDALDSRPLTRQQLAADVAARVGPWAREPLMSAWGELVKLAAYLGVLCYGEPRGAAVTFARLDQWTGRSVFPAGYASEPTQADGARALRAVLRRYIHTYGPVSHREVGRWFAMRSGDARELLGSVRDELADVRVEGADGYDGWILASDQDADWAHDHRVVRFVPRYDAYVLGAAGRDHIVPRPLCDRIFTQGRGRYEGAVSQNVVLVDGVVAGMWEQHLRARHIDLRVELFIPLTRRLRIEIDRQAEMIGAQHELSPAVVLGDLGRLTER